ncbi:MAG: DUF6527 family protein [Jatrophihabitantaceae bacterium]
MINTLAVEFVDFIPAALTPATLYVSMQHATTVHLCACGCGNKVVAPLSPAEWQLRFDGETISLTPSIGNWEFPCRSHYWITGSSIRLARPWSDQQIMAGRRRDAVALDQYHAGRAEPVTMSDQMSAPIRTRVRLRQRVGAWFGR